MESVEPWDVKWSDNAQKDLEQIPDQEIAKEFVRKMKEIRKNPYGLLRKLRKYPFYTYGVKNYRAIVQLQNRKLVIHVVMVKPRSRVYKSIAKT